MADQQTNEAIEHVLFDIQTARMITRNFASWVLPYDIYFTTNGIAFFNTVGVKGASRLGSNMPHLSVAIWNWLI